MTDIDIGSYTDAEMMDQLVKGSRVERFRFEHLDNNNESIRFLTTVVDGAKIDYNFFADIKRTMSLRMWETEFESALIKFGRDRIKIHMDILMPDGLYARRPLGVFLTSSPKRTSGKGIVTLDISGFDQTLVLRENTVNVTYTIPGGTVITGEITKLLQENKFQYRVVSSATTFGTDRVWPVGTTHAKIIQDMVEKLGYGSIWFDGNGVAQIEPYTLPENRTAQVFYATDQFSITKEEATDFLDLFHVANRWTILRSQADSTVISATITNDDPNDPTSTVGRGRVITDIRTDSDAADQDALNQQVRRLAAEASQKYREISFTTALVPLHGETTTIQLTHDPLGLSGVFNEASWSMELKKGGAMLHGARRSVKIGPVT